MRVAQSLAFAAAVVMLVPATSGAQAQPETASAVEGGGVFVKGWTGKIDANEKTMNLNDHPHPSGIVIAGNDLGTAQQSYLYCAANGNGSFIARGFGPEAFQLNGRRAEPNAAVNKAAGKGEPVTQEIALSVKGDKVECAINGTVVASYDKATLVAAGRLKSTDGVYGIRFAHNTEGTVSGLSVTKN